MIWCLTNIACGSHEQAGSILPLIPQLTKILGDSLLVGVVTSSNELLFEQVCWTLGNIAGDCDIYRQTTLQFGAMQPLVQFFLGSILNVTKALQGDVTKSVVSSSATTAAWALSNFARGSTSAVLFLDSGTITDMNHSYLLGFQ